jgi:hypothetical protein
MPEIAADPPAPSCYRLYPRPRFEEPQRLGPDPLLPRARRARAKGSSGNPRGRPGIPNPRPRLPDLAARPLSAQTLSDLVDRKLHLLRALAPHFRYRSNDNLDENLAADLLQIAHRLIIDSIFRCGV